MLKNYNYILTIMLYPFILLLELLMLKGILKSNLYLYLIIIMVIIFIPSFIMSLYNTLEEIFNSKRKWRVIFLVLFSLFYLPIYYTKYVSKEEKYLGFILCLSSLVLSYFVCNYGNIWMSKLFKDLYKNSVLINEHFTYTSSDNLFSIDVSSDFRCKNNDIGDYAISCEKLGDDSFIGVYRYDITDYGEKEIIDILTFHLNQSLEYISESGYEGKVNKEDEIIEINYHDMVVLLTQKNYDFGNNKYSLVIIKEMPKDNEDKGEFQKMIETIKFLNYNEEESS